MVHFNSLVATQLLAALERKLLPGVEQVDLGLAKVDDLRTAVAVLFEHRALFAVERVANAGATVCACVCART